MISIREVAKLAGVSPATVSRVLNGTAKVDAEKEKRIRRVIEETGYVPNEVARSLFKRSSKLIGLIVPNIENPFFSQLARHMEDAAYHRGYRIVLCNTNEVRNKEVDSIQMLTRMNADGIIITTTDAQLHLEAQKCPLPVVVMDRQLTEAKGLSYIMADHYNGGRMATEHLISCGCKNIVNIIGPQAYSSGLERYKGYSDVCKEYGIEEKTVECAYNFPAGMEAMKQVLSLYPEVDGIIACNDLVAFAVMKTLSMKGIQIPSDIQLIGFDNIEWGSIITPELTTIMQPTADMAEKAVELIIDEAEHAGKEKKAAYKFPVKLICRQTTSL